MTEYWFARRFPIGSGRSGMAPVHWKGHAVAAIFVIVLMLGGVAFAWLGAADRMAEGVAIFVLAAFMGGIFFITVANQTCDRVRTVADYKKDKQRA